MKFHNQKSFMGHEISNVKNKPLLHKKGKQWIVVAISALVLAGFGGMVSTTTHADTTAQPATTKVAPQPANNSGNASNVMKQAQGMHKALANNVAVQKPSAPSSTAAKKTAPASTVSTTSAKSSSVSASTSASSQASSSVSSASAKSSASNNSSSSNAKPVVHMLGMAAPQELQDSSIKQGQYYGLNYTFHNSDDTLEFTSGNLTWNYNGNGFIGQQDGNRYFTPKGIPLGKIEHIKFDDDVNTSNLTNAQIMFDETTNGTASGNDNLESIDFGNNFDMSHVTNQFDFISSDAHLSQLTLSPKMALQSAGDTSTFYSFSPKNGLTSIADGHTHAGSWVLLQKPYTTGNWGQAQWLLDKNGDLIIHDGSITDNRNDASGLNWNSVTHIYTYKVTAPQHCTSLFGAVPSYGSDTDYGSVVLPNLESVDVSGLDTSNTYAFNAMFCNDPNLSDIEGLSHLNGQSIGKDGGGSTLADMFAKDTKLTSLDLSGLNTPKNQWIDHMFADDTNLTTVNLGRSFVTPPDFNNNEANMFLNDNNLSQITLNNNDRLGNNLGINLVAKPTNNSSNLEVLNDRNNHSGTFKLANINGKWGTATWAYNPSDNSLYIANGTITDSRNDASNFTNWSNVKNIYTYNVNVPNSTANLFSYLSNLVTADMSGMTTNNVTNMNGMFDNDFNLQSIKFGTKFNTSNVTDFNYMFIADTNLIDLDLSGFDTRNAAKTFNPSLNAGVGIGSMLSNNDGGPKSSENTVPQQTLILGPNTILGVNNGTNGANLPDGVSFVNTTTKQILTNSDANEPHLTDGQPHKGTWTRNAEILNYMDQNTSHRVGQTVITKPLNTTPITVGSTPNGLPNGYHVSNPNQLFVVNGGITNIAVQPNSETEHINYIYHKNNTHSYNEGSTSITGSYGSSSNASGTAGLSAGYKLSNANNSFTYSNGNNSMNVSVVPITATDTINYRYNNSTTSSSTFTGNDVAAHDAGDNSFTVTNAPTGYHVASGANSTFNYDNGTYSLAVSPNTVTVNYTNGAYNSTATASYNSNKSTSDNFAMPNGYELAQKKNQLSFINPTSSVNVQVTPIPETDTIDYVNGSNSVSSSTFTGNDVAASGASNTKFTVTSAPVNYHLASGASSTFNYDSGTYNVSVVPNSLNVKFISNGNHDFVLSAGINTENHGSNRFTILSDLPEGYSLASSQSSTISLPNYNGIASVYVTPKKSAFANINYQYNGDTIASATTSSNSNNFYGMPSSVSNNTLNISGWHLASDGTQDFEFNNISGAPAASANGPVDVNIVPNVDTDTVNYQVNGYTLATQQFKGNDEHATQAGDNSFDVTAKNDTNIPSGYELVNSDNTFKFNNGTHNVAIQLQPAPYIPMVASSSAAPVTTVVAPASEAPTKSKPASHYRYTKVITPLQLHTSKHFTNKNGVLVIRHPMAFKIMKIVHDHKLTRYEVKYQGHNYFITGNDHFTINNYVQKHDFKSHKHMMVRVITPLIEYKHAHFNKKNAIKVFKKGAVLPVMRVFTIGKGEMTRFELTNGRYVTSNKLFVKVIK